MNQTANIHSKSMKFLEENIGVNLSDLWIGRDLLAITPKAEGKKERYTGFCQIKKKKKMCASKDNIKKMKRYPTDQKKIFTDCISGKEFIQST